MISIAMATYNGAEYLREQIESLSAQTTLPDELVVYDDFSTDGTRELLAQLKSEVPFEMRVIHGDYNVGVNHAFQAAIAACSGEIVFFCDQDDLWLPKKIERFVAAFETEASAGFVFCDALQVNSQGKDRGVSLWQLAKFDANRQAAYRRDPLKALLVGSNIIYGMASAFRAEVLRPFLPIRCSPAGMTHDTWFALQATAIGAQGIALPDQLVRYRRHNGQTTAQGNVGVKTTPEVRRRRALDHAQASIASLEMVRDNIQAHGAVRGVEFKQALGEIARKIEFLKIRVALRTEPSLARVIRGLLDRRYWAYAKGPLSVIKDALRA